MEAGLDPQCLELELTESVLMTQTQSTVLVLNSLKHIGVQLAVDDFGTGYSSLSYLRQFPIDSLKVDQSFVHEISSKDDEAIIVRAVITMGHSLQKRVIAEGVETREQLDFLVAAGLLHFLKKPAFDAMPRRAPVALRRTLSIAEQRGSLAAAMVSSLP